MNGNHSKNINIDWLMKVRGHLDKTEKRKQEIKQKKLPAFSGNSCLKKWFLSNLIEYFPHFQIKANFLQGKDCHSLNACNLETYTLTTSSKTYKHHKEMNNASQSCQDFSCHLEISEEKKNDRLISKKISQNMKRKKMF